jgi:hypothetical protein
VCLLPLLAGKRGGIIERSELPTFPVDAIYKVQPKVWFLEGIMLEWINEVLAPHVATAPPGIVPLLFLDSFAVHMMGSVVNKIQELGVEVKFIPPSCTGLVQPVNIGYNKSFKAKMKDQYMDWLMVQDPNAPIAKTTCRDVVGLILAAERNISQQVIRNVWRKTGFSYFTD